LKELELCKRNNSCRYCSSKNLESILFLGEHPPSNSFLKEEDIPKERSFPLEIYFCNDCALVQLLDVVSPEHMFGDYLYLSSTSRALKEHYAHLVTRLFKDFELGSNKKVCDIGCNDGILLDAYASVGDVIRIGVEPSSVHDVAEKKGHKIYSNFFTPEVAKKIVADHGKIDIASAMNIYPHVDDISEFTKGVKQLIAEKGTFIVEASYLIDLIEKKLFDTIYHEHLCYLSLTPVVNFLKKFDLEVFHVERLSFGASGPALRFFIGHKGAHEIQSSVGDLLTFEEGWGVKDMQTYKNFGNQVDRAKIELNALMSTLCEEGKSIGGYGAPAKGNTLLNYFEIDDKKVSCIAETNELKQGMLTPGSHIPIISEEEFLKRKPDYALLLTWNYLDFFLEKSEYIKNGGKFIVPLPEPRILP
jgi:hypothetical protein